MIRLATTSDTAAIMKFIDEHWKKGHILAVNEEMFRYEFEAGEYLNIVIAVDENGELEGMEGFIPYAHTARDSMLVIWKVLKTENPMLGLEILQYIRENTDSRLVASPGINRRTRGLYEYLGIQTGRMTQWYRLNKLPDYEIAVIKDASIPEVRTGKPLKKFSTFEELEHVFRFEKYRASGKKPYKEAWYIEKRYFNHPVYSYDVYGVMTGEECATLLVFRMQKLHKARAYRFVDVIGDFDGVYDATSAIDAILSENGAEYTDFYEVGMDENAMERAGWKKVENSGNIIPNYFAPFVQENIDIFYCSSDADIHLFKADGDQDRPN